ncbi:redox-sensitive transcriptional activator SoxR [Hyphomonas sp. WL0036]|uniref:redox-sensitive transcriptional activator SoxR n=1 Tax=Hyphomonas sediminis TaxID=2866160 RepID=UPI001C8104DA|nr:redox-sensitive transcriptional activator SoxR [Hyphomonas sediminis]MBY9066061.1 redox-sensitive transcriptional activator SoxR [Hyphomonas sediminis]
MSLKHSDVLTIGELAARTGVAVSALRYYEERGLVRSIRSAGRHRRFLRSDVRRVSFIRIAQSLGLSIEDIVHAFASLPEGRTPTAADWRQISNTVRRVLDRKIAALEHMRDTLDGCIGCGCLSLKRCALYNPGDIAGKSGSGPRYVFGGSD